MTLRARAALLIGAQVAFSGLLWVHPVVGDYEGLRDVTTRFQVVHVAMVLTFCLLAVGVYVLLDGLRGRAAAASPASSGRSARAPGSSSSSPRCSRSGVPVHR